jgi:DNA-binding beta-propeller fold protein YncE
MIRLATVLATATIASATLLPQSAIAQDGPYKVLATTKVGGEGGMDYIFADSDARKLYVARSGPAGHIAVFDIDSLKQVGDIPKVSAHGATVDTKYGHGIATAKPVPFFDAKTFEVIKTLDVQGNPDGYLTDPSEDRMYVLSHAAPNVTVIDAKDGTILGTIDLGGAPEQAVADGKGHLYIDLEDKDSIAVVDTKAMKLTGTFDVKSKGGGCAGLAMDVKNQILFATCRDKKNMIIVSAKDGSILADLPTGTGSDGAVFNPKTNEVFSSQGDGTLTIVKENSPTSFVVEQTVKTPVRAKTITLDSKTGKLYLMTAEYAAAPPAEPGARPARPAMVPDSFMIITVGK